MPWRRCGRIVGALSEKFLIFEAVANSLQMTTRSRWRANTCPGGDLGFWSSRRKRLMKQQWRQRSRQQKHRRMAFRLSTKALGVFHGPPALFVVCHRHLEAVAVLAAGSAYRQVHISGTAWRCWKVVATEVIRMIPYGGMGEKAPLDNGVT